MIELLQFPPQFGLMNASPFCMKVEVYLRLAGLPYRTVDTVPPGTPKSKLPVLRDQGRVIADSEAILDYLREAYAGQLPEPLRAPETGTQLLLRRTVEEHLYFAVMRCRWLDPAGAAHTRHFFDGVPAPVRGLVFGMVRRKMRRDLWGQGIGRHDDGCVNAKACADLDAVIACLGDQPFFAGAEPAAIDACLYAFLANLIWVPFETPIKACAQANAPLVAYTDRMRERVGR